MDFVRLKESIYQTLLSLATDDGIYASAKNEVYGCIFGRDSAITILKIIKIISNKSSYPLIENEKLVDLCKRSLLTLVRLQGKEKNIESGEEPGKFIHEFRKNNFERLVTGVSPWYVYKDGILRNYDSIDVTPLILIAIYKFWELTHDGDFIVKSLDAVEKGLEWIIAYGDIDNDLLLEYEFHKDRKFGGLKVQSWTDSPESLQLPNGRLPKYPIAPVEVQGYAWLALKLWAKYYSNTSNFKMNESLSQKLDEKAKSLKEKFNESFLFEDNDLYFAAQALDGRKNKIKTITGNPMLLLWASYTQNGVVECILDEKYISHVVKRSFLGDMFDNSAGIRTMSTKSLTYNSNQDSYHNGSFWPKLNGMAHEGLLNWGFDLEAQKLKEASLKPIFYFGSPIELYIKKEDNSYDLYKTATGQVSCRYQAWSAASTLDLLTL